MLSPHILAPFLASDAAANREVAKTICDSKVDHLVVWTFDILTISNNQYSFLSDSKSEIASRGSEVPCSEEPALGACPTL